MPRKAPLTDMLLRNAKAKDKAYKLSDGGGLFRKIMFSILPTTLNPWHE